MIEVKHTAKIFMVLLITGSISVLIISGVLAAGGCTQNTLNKLIPAYNLSIQFPADEEAGTLTAAPGTSVNLPVTIRSIVDVPISIRITQDTNIISPDFITLHGPDDYITLQPGANTTMVVTCNIADNATPGKYNAAIHGELEKPVKNRSEMGLGFQIIVINK
jgi:hypothetical protein